MDTLEIKHLTTRDLDSTSLSAKNIYTFGEDGIIDIASALTKLKNIPKDVNIPISINGITADANGNIQVPAPPEPIDQSYTAFAVLPTTVDVVVNDDGTVTLMDGETPRSFDKYPGLSSLSAVSTTIPAGSIHIMGIRSRIKPAIPVSVELSNATAADWVVPDPDNIDISVDYNIDISVDWGDGTISPLAACCNPLPELSDYIGGRCQFATQRIRQPSSKKEEYTYFVWHKYEGKALNEEHIVKILGDDWFAVTLDYADLIEPCCKKYCLVSRFLDKDLPMKNTIDSLAYFCSGSYRLTSINVPENMDLTAINHLFRVFNCCKNLKTVKGFNRLNTSLTDTGFSFSECTALQYCDYVLPHKIGKEDGGGYGIQQVFSNCSNLIGSVDKFLPKDGFIGSNATANGKDEAGNDITIPALKMSSLFKGCKKLTINDVSFVKSILWDSPRADSFIDYKNTFLNCSDAAVRRYVPTEWGGIDPTALTVEERIEVLEAKVAALEAQAQ